MLKTSKKYSRGFGILEVLISSTIIIVVLGVLVFIARNALTNAQYMQERAQAISLAAEGIETVRQIRDSNYIDGNAATKWNTIIGMSSANAINYGSTYYVDVSLPINVRLRVLPPPSPGTIKIGGVSYTRKIIFVNIASGTDNNQLLTLPTNANVSNAGGNGFEAIVQVTWAGSGGRSGAVELKELITNSRFVY